MSLPSDDQWIDPGPMDPPPRGGRIVLAAALWTVVAAIAAAGLWYVSLLGGLPDIGPPFAIDAVSTIVLPETENAFTYYRVASRLLTPQPRSSVGRRYLSWSQTPTTDRDWFLANVEALRAWIVGTRLARAVDRQPRDARLDSGPGLSGRLPDFIPLAQLAALRMEGQGDFQEAWTWHRAALRSTRHAGMYGMFDERAMGVELYDRVASSIRRWADHPNIPLELLRGALVDVEAINAMTPSEGENLSVQYLAIATFLTRPDLTPHAMIEALGGSNRGGAPDGPSEGFLRRLSRREPTRSIRALRLLVANWLAEADLPEAERIARRRDYPEIHLSDLPPDATASARRLAPDSLHRWIETTQYLSPLLPAFRTFDARMTHERAARDSLVRDLGERLRLREQGGARVPVAEPEPGGETASKPR